MQQRLSRPTLSRKPLTSFAFQIESHPGDSGGPLLARGASGKADLIFGVVSWGPDLPCSPLAEGRVTANQIVWGLNVQRLRDSLKKVAGG